MLKTWEPQIGSDFKAFLDKVPPAAKNSLIDSTVRILGRCVNERGSVASSVQLVVGEVQSGKTMSFTGTIALARDNGFPLIIVLGGTKDNLLNQTKTRLENDLGAMGDGGANRWNVYIKPDVSKVSELKSKLETWDNKNLPINFKQTTLILALKSVKSLRNISELLEELGKQFDLKKYPALIIDDEADQASLNTLVKKDEESSFYSGVLRIRSALPLHTFLMYTATPQAPLLLKIADLQSPDHVTLLESGEDYVGGEELFGEFSKYPIILSDSEVDIALKSESDQPPPNSLKQAVAVFLLSLVIAQNRQNPKPATMLVHPGAERSLHEQYEFWVKAIIENWRISLTDQSDIAFQDIKNEWFVPAFNELIMTVDISDDWPGVGDDVLEKMLFEIPGWISQIQIQVVNSTDDENNVSPEDWRKKPGWIVVGGNKLDRGFTVENLVTTYMPRGEGVSHADTIQQRGRFFGYKRPYVDLLRGWFKAETAQIFTNYVEHEEIMHRDLREIDLNNESLKDWRRKLFLDSSMKPTRKTVISIPNARKNLTPGVVFRQNRLFDSNLASAYTDTKQKIQAFYEAAIQDDSDGRKTNKNTYSFTDLQTAISLLADWPASPTDLELLSEIIFGLSILADSEEALSVKLYFMDNLNIRSRGAQAGSESIPLVDRPITNLFTGRQPTGVEKYPGDQAFISDSELTLQFHAVQTTNPVNGPVMALAIGWPEGKNMSVIYEIV